MVTGASDISTDPDYRGAMAPDIALSCSLGSDFVISLSSSTGLSDRKASWSWDTQPDSGCWFDPGASLWHSVATRATYVSLDLGCYRATNLDTAQSRSLGPDDTFALVGSIGHPYLQWLLL